MNEDQLFNSSVVEPDLLTCSLFSQDLKPKYVVMHCKCAKAYWCFISLFSDDDIQISPYATFPISCKESLHLVGKRNANVDETLHSGDTVRTMLIPIQLPM